MRLLVGCGLSVVGAGAFALAACGGSDSPSEQCQSLLFPGTRVAMPGIDVMLRDRAGHAVALGATVTAENAAKAVFNARGADQDTLDAIIYVSAGTYDVHVSKPSYRDTMVSNVVVVVGDCGDVVEAKVSVALSLAAGAPPVRSVAVLGASFLATPGSETRLAARVDADAGTSTAVTWQLSDTTIARIDPSGAVMAKCSMHGGLETATATSVVDRGVQGKATFGVGASERCP